MTLNPNPEKKVLTKKTCCLCGRKIVVARIDWEHRTDFVCATCKTLGKEKSLAQLRMVESKGVSERTKIKEIEDGHRTRTSR